MTTEEKEMVTSLLFSHRHLWMTLQEYRYLQEHPDVDYEAVHEIFHEESDEVYNSLAEALREGQPLQDRLQTVLLHSQLTEAEVQNQMKKKN